MRYRFRLNKEHVLPQIVARCWPFKNGKGRICDTFFSDLKFRSPTCKVTTAGGFQMMVEPSDLIGRHIYLTGEFDHTVCDVIDKFSRPTDTLLDIGANIGYVSACFLARSGAARVIAVEPQPSVLPLLQQNLAPFADRASIIPAALSDKDGTARISFREGNKGSARLSDRGIEVPVRAASSISAGDINVIKIDVEGHEYAVLSSLLPSLKTRARAIVFESHSDANRLASLFRDNGYRTFAIKKKLTGFDLVHNGTANDYVAIPQAD